MSLRPSPDIVWPTGLLTWPPSLPGICCWVIELTFIKGSCMASYRELTVLSSRRAPEFRNQCSTHPSLFPTIKETMKLYDPPIGPTTMRMTAFISLPSATGFGGTSFNPFAEGTSKQLGGGGGYKIQMFDMEQIFKSF